MPKSAFPDGPNGRRSLVILAAMADVCNRTARSWYHGGTLQPRTLERVNEAARRLGVEPLRPPRAKAPTGGGVTTVPDATPAAASNTAITRHSARSGKAENMNI